MLIWFGHNTTNVSFSIFFFPIIFLFVYLFSHNSLRKISNNSRLCELRANENSGNFFFAIYRQFNKPLLRNCNLSCVLKHSLKAPYFTTFCLCLLKNIFFLCRFFRINLSKSNSRRSPLRSALYTLQQILIYLSVERGLRPNSIFSFTLLQSAFRLFRSAFIFIFALSSQLVVIHKTQTTISSSKHTGARTIYRILSL